VALCGENFDGHDFLCEVVGNGVAAVLVERDPGDLPCPVIIVPNSLVALGEIASWRRRMFSIPVVGVTGSNGKTTVKEMISSIFKTEFGASHRLATQGNLNNEIGVPLTLMRLSGDHQAAVIEMGMSHPGEIARLTSIAIPTIGLVNNAQREHQEFMRSVEAVANENGTVLESLPVGGIAVFPGDDAFTTLWRGLASHSPKSRALTFGLSPDCDVRGKYEASEFGGNLEILMENEKFSVTLNVAGEHNARNALAAAACAHAAGVNVGSIRKGLEEFGAVKGRLERKLSSGGITVIDDTYNSNPGSAKAAIDVLAGLPGPRVLVLGDMGEVGEGGEEYHDEVARHATRSGIEKVLCLGHMSRVMTASGALHFDGIESLLSDLDAFVANMQSGHVLVKGSRFMKMERVVQHLTK
jgi:UDP-N-acetylmuramoyl-tripeptide--D-alanyl-D-alanine ligase